MTTTIFRRRMRAACAAIVTTAAVAACTLDKQQALSTTGPSEFGLAVTISATPDQLPRDGTSQSVVVATVRNAAGQPIAGQRLGVATTLGTLSEREIVTGADGRASVALTAPSSTSVGNAVTVALTPVGENIANAVSRTVSIGLTQKNASAPSPSFTFTPETPAVSDLITFDASGTTDDGAVCGAACTYAWSFGDGTSATGVVVAKSFSTAGNKTATLTVTDGAGASAATTQTVVVALAAVPSAGVIVFGPTPVTAGRTTYFDAGGATVGSGASLVEYTWVWNDGTENTVGASAQASHAFATAGVYTVRVIVRDNLGRTASATATVTVV